MKLKKLIQHHPEMIALILLPILCVLRISMYVVGWYADPTLALITPYVYKVNSAFIIALLIFASITYKNRTYGVPMYFLFFTGLMHWCISGTVTPFVMWTHILFYLIMMLWTLEELINTLIDA